MDKNLIIGISLIAVAFLAGIGGIFMILNRNQNNQISQTAESTDPGVTPGSTSDLGKTLIVYYSAQGHTESVAKMIAAETDADIFTITPAEPYTSDDLDYYDENSRVTCEHNDPSLRQVALANATVDNWADYDTVFIGYPIWWGIAAWPVNSFVEANDFTGKTVIPFCTAVSSDIGNSAADLAQLAGTGNWQSGHRFYSNADITDVQAWLNQL